MVEPVALFITWTTYGTWLPGDVRGHVSNTLNPRGGFIQKQNRPGTPYSAADAYTQDRAGKLQKWDNVWLTPPQAVVVANSLVRVALDRRWMILRGAIMSNHVHVVITGCLNCGVDPSRSSEFVRRILKGNTQADLSTAAGQNRRWWTAGGSDRRRSGNRSITATTQYVADQPGKLAEIVENVVIICSSSSELRG